MANKGLQCWSTITRRDWAGSRLDKLKESIISNSKHPQEHQVDQNSNTAKSESDDKKPHIDRLLKNIYIWKVYYQQRRMEAVNNVMDARDSLIFNIEVHGVVLGDSMNSGRGGGGGGGIDLAQAGRSVIEQLLEAVTQRINSRNGNISAGEIGMGTGNGVRRRRSHGDNVVSVGNESSRGEHGQVGLSSSSVPSESGFSSTLTSTISTSSVNSLAASTATSSSASSAVNSPSLQSRGVLGGNGIALSKVSSSTNQSTGLLQLLNGQKANSGK
ncbi:hypothetical protein HDU76_013197, partial [Blyttiomyces sp. JEL0837]